jgi:hypothetical protein
LLNYHFSKKVIFLLFLLFFKTKGILPFVSYFIKRLHTVFTSFVFSWGTFGSQLYGRWIEIINKNNLFKKKKNDWKNRIVVKKNYFNPNQPFEIHHFFNLKRVRTYPHLQCFSPLLLISDRTMVALMWDSY